MHPGLQLAALAIVLWLPGAALFRVPLLDRARREALSAEERAFWAVMLSVAISLASVLLLAWFGHYSLQRLLLSNALLTGALIAGWRGRLRMRSAPLPGLTSAAALALLALCSWRFYPPAEYVMGGKDPGVYVNEGVQIAQRGSLLLTEPVIRDLPAFARELFIPQHVDGEGRPRTDYHSTRFMGFFVKDPDAGTVVGQFPHLFPAAIAIGYGIDGLTGARRVTGVLATLGLLAVYFAGARTFGRTTATVAAALLALHVLEVWYARYPNAEALMQALTFTVVLANARAHVDGDRFFAPVAGALLGLMLFLRFDAVMVIGAVGAAALLGTFDGKRVDRWFIAAFALPALIAVAYLLGPMRAYAELPIAFFGRIYYTWAWWHYAAITVAMVAGWGLFRWLRADAELSARTRTALPVVLGVIVAAAGVYALFLRQPGGKLTTYDAYALRTFANVYFTVPAVLAALLGFWLTVRQGFWRDPALFITVALVSIALFYKIRIIPEHFWLGRRFIPVILPGALLFVSAAAFATAGPGLRGRMVRWTLGAIFIGLLATQFSRSSRPVVEHVEYAGLIPHLETLANRFSDQDLIVVESRDAQSDVHVLALPLAYIYSKNVLLLASARPDKAGFAAFVEWAATKYQNVYFIGGGGTDLLSHSYGVRPVASDRFQVPEFESSRTDLPRLARQKEFEFGVYRFGPPESAPGLWFDLDVGTNDDLHVLRFHAKETSDGRTFRWTQSRSYISVTTIRATNRELTLTMADGGRPAAAQPADVEVFLHNQQLGSVRVAGPFRPYTFAIPAELAERAAGANAPAELRLLTKTWKPSSVLGTGDDRELGVMVDRVIVK